MKKAGIVRGRTVESGGMLNKGRKFEKVVFAPERETWKKSAPWVGPTSWKGIGNEICMR